MKPIYEKEDVKIYIDEDPVNPRKEWDHLGTIMAAHKRYSLGDEQAPPSCGSWDGVRRYIESEHGPCIVLDVFMYDHSGLTIRTTPFSCPWDSGQVGFCYVPLSKVRKEYGVKRISPKLKQKVIDILESEVRTYDQYLRGEVYGYVRGDDSCWGFYGYEPEQLADAVLKGEV
jgi:hypothetical protein